MSCWALSPIFLGFRSGGDDLRGLVKQQSTHLLFAAIAAGQAAKTCSVRLADIAFMTKPLHGRDHASEGTSPPPGC
jgi:hypothetical protein